MILALRNVVDKMYFVDFQDPISHHVSWRTRRRLLLEYRTLKAFLESCKMLVSHPYITNLASFYTLQLTHAANHGAADSSAGSKMAQYSDYSQAVYADPSLISMPPYWDHYAPIGAYPPGMLFQFILSRGTICIQYT